MYVCLYSHTIIEGHQISACTDPSHLLETSYKLPETPCTFLKLDHDCIHACCLITLAGSYNEHPFLIVEGM